MDKYVNYDWAQLIDDILDGIRRVFEFFKNYMPKSQYKFEDESNYKD